MNLVRWFRKNKTKVLAVVVIVIMLGFIGGAYIQQLSRKAAGLHKAVAHFGEDRKITNADLRSAQSQLETLRMLGADTLLRSIGLPMFRQTPDLRTLLLAELLFPQRRISPQMSNQIKQIVRARQYKIGEEQINDIYRGPAESEIYWLLLKTEARQAGVRISREQAGRQLAGIIPQVADGAAYSQVVRSIVNRRGIAEDEILAAFGDLLGVIEYAKMICTAEDVTQSQIRYAAAEEAEKINVEFVKLDSALFAQSPGNPTDEQLLQHFEKYKQYLPGTVTDENPYGFGYKLPPRVRLEYLAVKLDDVSNIIALPTADEAERYYADNPKEFTTMVPSDPNDPNSAQVEKTKTYAQVAGQIKKRLKQNRINSKAEQILQEAKDSAQAGLTQNPTEPNGPQASPASAETLVDYAGLAEKLTDKYKTKVYAGKTGLLSAADIRNSTSLGTLFLQSSGYNPVDLTRVVFAVEPLNVSRLGPFDVSVPKMYESIGPLTDISGQIMTLVRVIEAKKAAVARSIDYTFSKKTLALDDNSADHHQDQYVVRDKVAEDLKRLAAMETVKTRARELTVLVAEKGWTDALTKYNELYAPESRDKQSDPNVFELRALSNLRRVSNDALHTMQIQIAFRPGAESLLAANKNERLLMEKIYSLVPPGTENTQNLPAIVEFKPHMSYYVIKSLSVERLEESEFQKTRAIQAYRENIIQCQSMAAVHYNPQNIVKRMNFVWARRVTQPADSNVPVSAAGKQKGAS